MTNKIEKICIIGSGFMGAQIGLHCAAYGYQVWLIDNPEKALERATQSHIQELDRRIEKQQMTTVEKTDILTRLHLSTKISDGLANADLVIEALPEMGWKGS